MSEAPEPAAGRPAGPSCAGCVLALALGVSIVGGVTVAFSLLAGQPLRLREEGWTYFWQMLMAGFPFAVLALAGARHKLPWLVALALTLALWGDYLWSGVSYQRRPDGSGADIGLGLLMMASPLFISAAGLSVYGLMRWWERR